MRVGFDARWYNDSGVGTYVVELLKALVPLQSCAKGQAGFELVVYEDPRNPVPGLTKGAVARAPLSSGKYSLAGQVEIKVRCQEDALDVFHSPFYPIPLRTSCPVVVTIHDLIPFLFRTANVAKQSVVKRGYKIAARRSSQIIAVSHHTAGDVQKILGTPRQKLTVIHNGVSEKEFHAKADPGEAGYLMRRYGVHSPYVVAASARNWQTKNLINALKALSLARSQAQTEFQTVVYGPPDGLAAVGGADAWRNLSPVQTGLLAAADLARLFRNAHLFVMPTLYEGFGLAVLEAMACGCAVITSNSSSLPEVTGEGAQRFDPLDVEGMAGAIVSLLSNPPELKLWRQRALSRSADFPWSKAAQETVAVYHRAIGDCRG